MLLINPHTSFYFRGEVHVVSEEGLNAYGAVTWGQFFVYQGFNENTGWMHTSTYVDFMDEFVEDVSARTGSSCIATATSCGPVEELRGDARGTETAMGCRERTFPMYRTHHGPVTHAVDGTWVATRINWDPVNALTPVLSSRTKLANYDEFREMMDIRTNSSNNTVFADSEGNIAYFHGNFMPKRDPQFDYSKPVDGSNPGDGLAGTAHRRRGDRDPAQSGQRLDPERQLDAVYRGRGVQPEARGLSRRTWHPTARTSAACTRCAC